MHVGKFSEEEKDVQQTDWTDGVLVAFAGRD